MFLNKPMRVFSIENTKSTLLSVYTYVRIDNG